MKQEQTGPLVSGVPKSDAQVSTAPTGRVLSFEEALLKRLLIWLGSPPIRVILWDGREVYESPAAPVGKLRILDRGALYQLLVNPDLQFGELYVAGRVVVEGDLVEVLVAVDSAMPDFAQRGLWVKLLSRLYLLRRNTIARARDNIYHHYDISNDFYKLWLDDQLVYTCAYFPTQAATLEEAQIAKMDHVARKLRLKPGDNVVEAGCGWGSLALHMAKRYGAKVKAYNISREQIAYARKRAKREGMDGQVEYIEGDYRTIDGHYDVFVSVGMLEHVGLQHFQDLGRVIDRCLRNDGRGLIHSIGRNRPAPMNAWIEKRIFPGGYPPSLGEMRSLFEPFRFSILDVENLRLHYALTLRHWLERYEKAKDRVAEMFDETFVRTWRLYLAGSIATFITGELQLFQVTFARYNNNAIPWTRDYLYDAQRL